MTEFNFFKKKEFIKFLIIYFEIIRFYTDYFEIIRF